MRAGDFFPATAARWQEILYESRGTLLASLESSREVLLVGDSILQGP